MFWKARTNLIYEKVSPITRNMGRCTELTQEWLGWQDKLATSMYLQNPLLAFIIRISIHGVTPKAWKVLQLLHHCHIFSGTFVKINKASVNMLRIVEPHITHKLPWQTTHWLLALLLNLESSAWKIWFTRSIMLNNAFKKATTSAGPSNDLFHEVEWRWWRSSIL